MRWSYLRGWTLGRGEAETTAGVILASGGGPLLAYSRLLVCPTMQTAHNSGSRVRSHDLYHCQHSRCSANATCSHCLRICRRGRARGLYASRSVVLKRCGMGPARLWLISGYKQNVASFARRLPPVISLNPSAAGGMHPDPVLPSSKGLRNGLHCNNSIRSLRERSRGRE